MPEQNNYICKVATLEEIEERWNEEANKNGNTSIYQEAKNEFINEVKKRNRIVYIGKIKDTIICDLTVILKPEGIKKEAKSNDNIINDTRVFLCAIRTNKEEENKGYFSKLLSYVENELLKQGYKEISLSVEENEKRNKNIYEHLGFTNYIKTEIIEGNGTIYTYHYLYKTIKNTSNK